ncbi:hypothetical protein EC973_008015 [Apophysomyces ossiformis]|uniref:Uncharacterized protein n=1 Tax=Apophysomyces ossiformis TaxID=679940 RepID=A0A8H7EJL9_9FUNG|nr:hypothetical protein EC973_008015 [Apophysomyces ossiformis]
MSAAVQVEGHTTFNSQDDDEDASVQTAQSSVQNDEYDSKDDEDSAGPDDMATVDTALATIQQAGRSLHEHFQSGRALTESQRNIMSLGTSSIIDFVDEDKECQRSLFNEADWATLRAASKSKFEGREIDLPPALLHVWNQVVECCQQGNFRAARSHVLMKIMEEPTDINVNKGLLIIDQVSETTNPYSSEMKRQQYPHASHATSFKIDFRIIFSHHHRHKNIDLAAGEAARNTKEKKVKIDHGKITREAKEVLDRLILSTISGNPP